MIEGNDLTFASLKHEVGIESSGQLQHHLQKLSALIAEKSNGSYGLTYAGRRALDIFRESEGSGRSLEEICCLPAPSEMAQYKQVGRAGCLLRFSIGMVLIVLALGIVTTYLLTGQLALSFNLMGTSFVSFGVGGAAFFGFFGVSFLVASVTKYPGCEITAIPNLFIRRKRYCACLITPYNLPDGRLTQSVKART